MKLMNISDTQTHTHPFVFYRTVKQATPLDAASASLTVT